LAVTAGALHLAGAADTNKPGPHNPVCLLGSLTAFRRRLHTLILP